MEHRQSEAYDSALRRAVAHRSARRDAAPRGGHIARRGTLI